MENRKWYALIVIGILYMSSAGQYLNNNIAFEQASILALFDIAIISLIMLIVPFGFRLKSENLIEYTEGRKICIWNSIIIFIISLLISITNERRYIIGGLGALAYYFVNMWLFVYPKDAIEEESNNQKPNDKEDAQLKELISTIEKENKITALENIEKKKKYCTDCGKEIDINWSFCNYCGNKLK